MATRGFVIVPGEGLNVHGVQWPAGPRQVDDPGWLGLLREAGAKVVTEAEYLGEVERLRTRRDEVTEFERGLVRERVVPGPRHATAHGARTSRPVGRPRRAVDVEEVRRRRESGQGWRTIARALHCPSTTLRRALQTCQNPQCGIVARARASKQEVLQREPE